MDLGYMFVVVFQKSDSLKMDVGYVFVVVFQRSDRVQIRRDDE